MKKLVVLAITSVLLILLYISAPPANLDVDGFKVLVLFVSAAIWWISDIVPPMITGLFVIVAAYFMGLADVNEIFRAFGNKSIFLVLGVFIISSSLKRAGIIEDFMRIFVKPSESEKTLSLKIYLLSFFLSTFMVSHTVVALLLPVIFTAESSSAALALLLGSAVGSNLTPLGGARGPLSMMLIESMTGMDLSFLDWLRNSWIVVLITWIAGFYVIVNTSGDEKIKLFFVKRDISKYRKRATLIVFMITATLWIVLSGVVDMAIIALSAVVALFLLGVVRWEEIEEDVNWGVILMYGGALILSNLMMENLSIDGSFEMFGNDILYFIFVAFVSLVVTEFMSNSASVILLSQIFIPVSQRLGINPVGTLFSITLPSGLAVILPVGSPSTAMILSSGILNISDTFKVGLKMGIACLIGILISSVTIWGF